MMYVYIPGFVSLHLPKPVLVFLQSPVSLPLCLLVLGTQLLTVLRANLRTDVSHVHLVRQSLHLLGAVVVVLLGSQALEEFLGPGLL